MFEQMNQSIPVPKMKLNEMTFRGEHILGPGYRNLVFRKDPWWDNYESVWLNKLGYHHFFIRKQLGGYIITYSSTSISFPGQVRYFHNYCYGSRCFLLGRKPWFSICYCKKVNDKWFPFIVIANFLLLWSRLTSKYKMLQMTDDVICK